MIFLSRRAQKDKRHPRRFSAKTMRGKKLSYNVLLLILTSVFCFIILEVVLRIFFGPIFYANEIYHVPKPYVEFSGRPGFNSCSMKNPNMGYEGKACLSFNQLGLRGNLPGSKNASEYRILFFGGSTAFNGEPLNNSIPLLLESELHEMRGGSNVRVYDWGVVSYNSAQQLVLLTMEGIDYSPDMVIFYQGANDLGPFNYDPRPNYPYNYLTLQSAVLSFQDDAGVFRILSTGAKLLLRKSIIIRVLDAKTGGHLEASIVNKDLYRQQADYGSEEWKREIVDSYAKNTEKAALLCNAKNIRFVAIHQPLLNYKHPLTAKERALVPSAEFSSFIAEVYPEMGRCLGNMSGSRVTGKDLKDIFNNTPEDYFWDFTHTDNRGNAFIAHQIADVVHPLLVEDIGK